MLIGYFYPYIFFSGISKGLKKKQKLTQLVSYFEMRNSSELIKYDLKLKLFMESMT